MEGQESQVVFEDKELYAKFQEMTEKGKKRRAFVAGLRELADWYEQAPHWMPEPNSSTGDLCIYTNQVDGLKPADVAASLGGYCEKRHAGPIFYLTRKFGSLRLDVNFGRESVCERKVIKRLVPETIVPASEGQVIPEHEEEVVEWDCSRSIFADAEKQKSTILSPKSGSLSQED